LFGEDFAADRSVRSTAMLLKPSDSFGLGTVATLDVEPHGYLADVIARIVNGHPQVASMRLMPWAYPATPKLRAVA